MILQPSIPPTPAGVSLANKTAIVTGGNAGLGLEAARQFLALGAARVIITARSASKGQQAVETLRSDHEVHKLNPKAVVEYFELDLDDYKSAVAFVKKVKAEIPELDVLLLNAGMNVLGYQSSKSGHESVMQANYYSNALISLSLVPLLRVTAQKRGVPSHLTIVGSLMHLSHTLAAKPVARDASVISHFDDAKLYSSLTRYQDSKLAVAAFVRELSTRIPASEVIVNTPCPGLVATGFDKNLPFYVRWPMAVFRKIAARNVEAGGRTLVYASYVADTETHGQFVQHNKVDQIAPFLEQPAGKTFSDSLWAETVEDVAKYDPGLKTYA